MASAGAPRAVIAAHPGQRLAIVTHGTLLALFLGQQNGIAAQPFWRSLAMPALVLAALPDFRIAQVVERVE